MRASTAQTPVTELWSVADLAQHYRRAEKTIRNRLTQGWGPKPVLDSTSGRALGWRPETVDAYDRSNEMTREQYLYPTRGKR